MKTLRPLLVLFIALFTVSACKKEKEESDELRLVGEWEIRSSVGGLSPSTQFPEGNGKILKFSETGYQRLENGQVIKSGTYEIIEEKFWAGNYRIVFDGDLTGLTQYTVALQSHWTAWRPCTNGNDPVRPAPCGPVLNQGSCRAVTDPHPRHSSPAPKSRNTVQPRRAKHPEIPNQLQKQPRCHFNPNPPPLKDLFFNI